MYLKSMYRAHCACSHSSRNSNMCMFNFSDYYSSARKLCYYRNRDQRNFKEPRNPSPYIFSNPALSWICMDGESTVASSCFKSATPLLWSRLGEQCLDRTISKKRPSSAPTQSSRVMVSNNGQRGLGAPSPWNVRRFIMLLLICFSICFVLERTGQGFKILRVVSLVRRVRQLRNPSAGILIFVIVRVDNREWVFERI